MSSNQEVRHQQPRRRGPMGRGMQPGEKPKDLKKSIKQLMQYIGKYKIGIFIVMICAACSTVFTVIGPKILGKATTALSEGLMDKIKGTGSIDFTKIGIILLFVLGLYLCSALFSFYSGLDYDRGDPEDLLPAPEGNLGEDQSDADEVF